MGSGIFFPISALPIILIIILTFNLKQHIETVETRLYNWLIMSNLFGLIIEIACEYACKIFETNYLLSSFILKSYLIYLLVWTAIFTTYIFVISKPSLKHIYFDIHHIVLMFICIIVYILPIDIVIENDFQVHYTTGLSVNFAYFVSFIYVIVILFVMLQNIKDIRKKKYLPVFLFFVIGTISIVIQKLYPQFLLLTYAQTLICLCMYFTIENPDLKMLNELELAKKNAERANNAKTEFLSNMSHEIRTPLNAIVGFSNSIMEDDSLEEAQNEAKDIIMASNNLLEIVNGILDISKIEAGKMEIVNVNYKPRVVFNDLVKLIKPRIVEKPIELKVSISDDIPYVLFGDMGKVKEIITNLLTNAAKYTEKGVIEFAVSCINDKDSSKLVISVEDTGRGIKSDKIDKLFSKFDRLDEDKNTTLEGTGLGLAITKSLIEMMGGKIIVQSKYGSGSKFTVYLSQKIISMVDDGKDEENVLGDDDIDYSDKRLLVVDDNNLNIKVAARMLKNYNIVPDTCLDGYECLEKVKNNKYDLILLDDMMPKMSGVETLGKLKEDSNFDIPVVVLTANAISGMREKYLKDGFNDYLAKPIDKLELRRVLKEFLEKK